MSYKIVNGERLTHFRSGSTLCLAKFRPSSSLVFAPIKSIPTQPDAEYPL
jgi:hypothetical protein